MIESDRRNTANQRRLATENAHHAQSLLVTDAHDGSHRTADVPVIEDEEFIVTLPMSPIELRRRRDRLSNLSPVRAEAQRLRHRIGNMTPEQVCIS